MKSYRIKGARIYLFVSFSFYLSKSQIDRAAFVHFALVLSSLAETWRNSPFYRLSSLSSGSAVVSIILVNHVASSKAFFSVLSSVEQVDPVATQLQLLSLTITRYHISKYNRSHRTLKEQFFFFSPGSLHWSWIPGHFVTALLSLMFSTRASPG